MFFSLVYSQWMIIHAEPDTMGCIIMRLVDKIVVTFKGETVRTEMYSFRAILKAYFMKM